MRALLLTLALATPATAQWTIQTSNTTASLRGVHALGNGVAWASGSEGTVLRTTDNGTHWLRCATPPDAEKLDFRGVQAFDASTAIVMSSGKGDLSRLYKTTDGCKTWKLVFTNPEKEGFWDALLFNNRMHGVLFGDPVNGKFYARESLDGGLHWRTFFDDDMLRTGNDSGIFAASNSAFVISGSAKILFAVNNLKEATGYLQADFGPHPCHASDIKSPKTCGYDYVWKQSALLPIAKTGESSGVFSIAVDSKVGMGAIKLIAVGGDYKLPDVPGSAAYCTQDLNLSQNEDEWPWQAATTPPHGYRSAVAYDTATTSWITVGPNGTDISTDDGRNWRALKPSPGEPADADQHWNALSLPFVVGPHGRIGILNSQALK